MSKQHQEWLKQADYDMDTARFMLKGGRHFYAIFMCHLSIEKPLKGVYVQRLGKEPPKIHNLIYFVENLKLSVPEDLHDFIFTLNRVSVPTRYPDDLERILKDYTRAKTLAALKKGAEVLKWLKAMLQER